MKRVSILIPAYNEEESLPLLYRRLADLMDAQPTYAWEVLFVNDGSRDHTLAILAQLRESDPRINYLDLSRNYGKEAAMLAGFDYVTGDCMVIMDFLRRRLTAAFYALLRHTTRVTLQPNTGDFRLLDAVCIRALRRLRESQRYTKGMFSWIGFRKHELLFDQQDRVAGQSKWGFFKLLNLAVEGITSFTVAPLRIASVCGAIVSLLAFAYGLFILLKNLIYDDPVAGFPTLMVTILFLGGVQLLCIGIIGEYLGRIFTETKQRPVYFVSSYNGERVD